MSNATATASGDVSERIFNIIVINPYTAFVYSPFFVVSSFIP